MSNEVHAEWPLTVFMSSSVDSWDVGFYRYALDALDGQLACRLTIRQQAPLQSWVGETSSAIAEALSVALYGGDFEKETDLCREECDATGEVSIRVS